MQKFRDTTGKTWEIDLPIGEVVRIRQASEGRFNLWEPTKDNLGDRLANDIPLFWELLWYIVEPQAEEAKITAKEFGKAVAAECLYEAQRKFFDEWHDFFLRLQRPDLAAVLEKLSKYRAKALELVKAKLATGELDQIDPKVEAKLQATLNESFGKLRERLDSILAPSPGGNSGDSDGESSVTSGS